MGGDGSIELRTTGWYDFGEISRVCARQIAVSLSLPQEHWDRDFG
jgi:hypothetical protein